MEIAIEVVGQQYLKYGGDTKTLNNHTISTIQALNAIVRMGSEVLLDGYGLL
ncbi:hypothetical protein [Pelotomaculum sp. FP]|uniref:hypothetical protein n=1 Tax=Pelotomaculum sp. FP TaxID=261474 RepID=UPI0018647190|nr:hypothetical protein [Pelotomaculum sp. FP]